MLLALLTAAHASTLYVWVRDEEHLIDSRSWVSLERDRVILYSGGISLRVRVRKRAAGGAVVRLSRCRDILGDRCKSWTSTERLRFEYGEPDRRSYFSYEEGCGAQETPFKDAPVEVTGVVWRPQAR